MGHGVVYTVLIGDQVFHQRLDDALVVVLEVLVVGLVRIVSPGHNT